MRTTAVIAAMGLGLAGCDDDGRTITVHARGAALVAIDLGDGWEPQEPGDLTFAEPDGLYRIAVTCRVDTMFTTVLIAAPGDRDERTFQCSLPSGVEVGFDVTGDVYGMYVGLAYNYRPEAAVEVEPGTYDVVATRQGTTGVDRVQVTRDVVIDGPTRVTIDVERLGAPLETVPVRLDDPGVRTYVTGLTARGTWFLLDDETPRRLATSARVPGDRHTLQASATLRETGLPVRYSYASIPIGDGDDVLDVVLPRSGEVATFVPEPAPAASWSAVDGWDWAGIDVWQDNTYGVPGWNVRASTAALARGATLSFPSPPPPGWQPSWAVDLAGSYRWSASLGRYRADGGAEALSQSGGRAAPPTP